MNDSSPPILEARNLRIGYGTTTIGTEINFTLVAGQILCLLGPNGSGKSTLFKSLLGLIPLLGGQVLLQGLPLASSARRHIAQQVAYVPQATEGMFSFQVLDVVVMGRSAHIGMFAAPSQQDKDIALQSLAQQPQALILDEPTASLDFGNQIRVLEQIHALRDQGLAIFLCTHQPEHAYRVADKVLLFKKGNVAAAGVTATTLTAEALAQLYDLPITVVRQHLQNTIT